MILGILPASRWIDALRYELHNVAKTLRMLGHIDEKRHKVIELSTAMQMAEICLLEALAGKMSPLDEKRMRHYVTRRVEQFFSAFVCPEFVDDVAFDAFFESFYSEVMDDIIISMDEMLDLVTAGRIPFDIMVSMRGGNFFIEDAPLSPARKRLPSQRAVKRKPLAKVMVHSRSLLSMKNRPITIDPSTRRALETWLRESEDEDGDSK